MIVFKIIGIFSVGLVLLLVLVPFALFAYFKVREVRVSPYKSMFEKMLEEKLGVNSNTYSVYLSEINSHSAFVGFQPDSHPILSQSAKEILQDDLHWKSLSDNLLFFHSAESEENLYFCYIPMLHYVSFYVFREPDFGIDNRMRKKGSVVKTCV